MPDSFFDDERHDEEGRPLLAFIRTGRAARRPEQLVNTENSFTLFATERIYSLRHWHTFKTGVAVRMPSNYSLAVQADPFAVSKGVMVISPLVITNLHREELTLAVINLWPEPPAGNRRQMIIDINQPLAVVTLVHTPICNAEFDGWDEKTEEAWK